LGLINYLLGNNHNMEQTITKFEERQLKTGCEVTQLVLALPGINPSLETLMFNIYSPYPGLEERFAQSADTFPDEIAERARDLKKSAFDDIPYWESILVAASSREKFGLFIQEAIRHDVVREFSDRFEIPVSNLTGELLQEHIARLSSDRVLALCSKCRLRDGSLKHIPMMDFRCLPSPENLEKIKTILKGLGQRNGAIVESGRSYHFYGFELLDQNEWIRFLAQCLLLHPFTDSRYIAHRLMGGTCALRITATKLKPKIPIVLELV
jgi:hypothetical protein